RELFQKSRDEMRALMEKRHKEFLAILTPEQKKTLEDMRKGRGRQGRGRDRGEGRRDGRRGRDRGESRRDDRRGRDRGPADGGRDRRRDDRRGRDGGGDARRKEIERKIEQILKEVEELRRELRRR